MSDWRTPASGDREIPLNLATLFAILHLSSEDKHHDVTFKLPDGGEVGGHKIVLAVASPVFEAQFYGPMAADNTDVVTVRDVEPGAFRMLLDCIYNSGIPDAWDLTCEEYWDLLYAAHMYLLPKLMKDCEAKLEEYIESLSVSLNTNFRKVIEYCKRAHELSLSETLARKSLSIIKTELPMFFLNDPESLNMLDVEIMKELIQNLSVDLTEGEMFTIAVNWSKANAENEVEAQKIFEESFIEKFDVRRISHNMFKEVIVTSGFLPVHLYNKWAMKVMENKFDDDLTRGNFENFVPIWLTGAKRTGANKLSFDDLKMLFEV